MTRLAAVWTLAAAVASAMGDYVIEWFSRILKVTDG